jgi:hypothetical protein
MTIGKHHARGFVDAAGEVGRGWLRQYRVADPGQDRRGAEDEDRNGYPDPCDLDRGDLNMDGVINGADFGLLLTWWGAVNYPIGDLNHDGIINGSDVGKMLANWGPTH